MAGLLLLAAEEAKQHALDARAVLLERQVVGVVAEGLLDLHGDVLEILRAAVTAWPTVGNGGPLWNVTGRSSSFETARPVTRKRKAMNVTAGVANQPSVHDVCGANVRSIWAREISIWLR